MILVSVDDHLAEPPHLFDAHIPERHRDREPKVVRTLDGADLWVPPRTRTWPSPCCVPTTTGRSTSGAARTRAGSCPWACPRSGPGARRRGGPSPSPPRASTRSPSPRTRDARLPQRPLGPAVAGHPGVLVPDQVGPRAPPPRGPRPRLTERQREVLDASVAPLMAGGGQPASHQLVANQLGISRSLVRLECNRISERAARGRRAHAHLRRPPRRHRRRPG